MDARWTKKHGISYYGYKNSICIDVDHGFIRRYAVTPANIHNSQMLPRLLDPENEHDKVWTDSAYSGECFEGTAKNWSWRGLGPHPLQLLQWVSLVSPRGTRIFRGALEYLLNLGGFESLIHEKGTRNHPLSDAAKELNRVKSSIRACVEHVFGCMTMSMGGKLTSKIGIERNEAWWGLKNLTFNFLLFLQRSSHIVFVA